jgi:hypothetical protein
LCTRSATVKGPPPPKRQQFIQSPKINIFGQFVLSSSHCRIGFQQFLTFLLFVGPLFCVLCSLFSVISLGQNSFVEEGVADQEQHLNATLPQLLLSSFPLYHEDHPNPDLRSMPPMVKKKMMMPPRPWSG